MIHLFKLFLFTVGLMIFVSISTAASHNHIYDASHSLRDSIRIDGCRISETTSGLALRAFHLKPRDMLLTACLVGTVFLSSTFDRSIRSSVRDLDSPWADRAADIGHIYQNKYLISGAASSLYVYGLVFDKPGIRRVGLEIFEAFIIAGAGTLFLKHMSGRARPFTGDGPKHFTEPTTSKHRYLSFISGDVTNAFAMSTVLAAETHSIPVKVFVYGLASMTAFQRIHVDQHWFSDTVGAAIWATVVGTAVVKLNRIEHKFQIQPAFNGSGLSIAFMY